jgi:hypothetical protein
MFRIVSLLAGIYAVGATGAPGKIVVWSSSRSASPVPPKYDTRTMDLQQVGDRVNELTEGADAVVLLSHSEQQLPNVVRDSVKGSNSANVLPYVYHTIDTHRAGSKLEQFVLAATALKGAKRDSIDPLANPELLSDNKHDAFVVNLKGDSSDAVVLNKLSAFKSVLFVAVEEPTSVSPKQRALYNRILANEPPPEITAEDLYLPEGTEFTIWYAGQYLYLTPELFTGLMTMLFMFFVILIGLSCLNEVRGPACYPTKMPTLGKEG